jgi:hypothetical protein
MRDKVSVQYMGFEAKALAREYSFLVQQESGPREVTLVIFNDAFSSRHVSFQDAPSVCAEKLRRELAVFSNDPPLTQYRISELELKEYRDAHSPRSAAGLRRRKAATEL